MKKLLMNSRRVLRLLTLVVPTGLPLAMPAQTLNITNGVQIYVALTNTTVTMSGRCELRLMATNNPMPGCMVNLNSADAWFFLPNIRPSVVSASYLSQVMVNGASAVAGSNCRVEEYDMGTVIVPQSPGVTPLQVFSGPNFLGGSNSFGIYTYYNTSAALGVFRWNIGSFRLQRGYSATFAQNADGTGASKVYVAQDGDLDVAAMPANLDHQCNFVRVIPWHWIGKKGWGGGVDGNLPLVDALWNYDWGNGATSTANVEYIPMQWGGGYSSGINSKQGSSQVLGYNEPDNPPQANLTVAQALAYWPYMMQSGLRVGAPAVSDSGLAGQGVNWLYSFMSQATNLGYRVDFVPVHSYKCNYSASQLSNYLAGIYQTVGRPIWLTEFNFGADWCSPDNDTSQAVEATEIASYISMLESCPFIERYAIYQWFGANREMVVNGVLTPAGTNYFKQQSAMAYKQEIPPGGSRGIAQFEFENNADDGSGYGNNGCAFGTPGYVAGHTGQAVVLDGTNSFIQLPPTIAQSNAFTFAAWVYWNGGANWQRIFDFGDDTSHYMFLTPSSGSGTLRFAINNGSGEQIIETTPLPVGQWTHVAVTLASGSAKLFTNGVLAASSASFTIVPSSFTPALNYLGKSQFPDPLFNGMLDEVQIADTAFTPAQIAALLTDMPPQFTTNILSGGSATQLAAYSGSIAGTATDADAGDTLTYSKAVGPAWLNVAADGTLSGTPTMTDGGTNNFTVRVTDAAGASAEALLTIVIPFDYGNGTWLLDSPGSWSDTSKWVRGCPANGAGLTADFSTLDISVNRPVTLDTSRSIGALKFADYSGTQYWVLGVSGGSVLTLDSGTSSSPSIVVGTTPSLATSNAVTIIAPLAGTNGFTKTGWGTLYLTGGNPLSGTLNMDSGSTSANDGAVCLASAGAGTNLTAIAFRNNNSGRSTLQLSGGAVSPAAIALNGRTTNAAAIENISGGNSLTGDVTINVGGGYYIFQSDAGTLNLGGVISSAATGARMLTFQGAADELVSGSIQDGSATVGVVKQDRGNLILANPNPFSGALAVGGGAVKIVDPLAVQNQRVNLGCIGTNTLKFGPISGAAIGSLSGLGDVYLTNSSGAALTLTNGGNNASGTFAGAFRGSGSVLKTGGGTLTLTGTNANTGATIVAGGTLKFGTATNVIASLQPVLWMSFDAVSGGVVTNWGNGGWGMNGTLIGSGASVTSAGRWGNALYLDGTGTNTANNVVLIPNKGVDTSASGRWSVGYWVKTTTGGGVIMYQGDGTWSSSGQTMFYLNNGNTSSGGTHAGAVRWGGNWLTGTANVADGNWHFVMLVDNGGTETIYVDGNTDATTGTMSGALASGANQIWIGGSPDAGDGAVRMTGFIDDVCMFSRALSQAEIRAIYTNAPVAGKLPAASAVSVASGATLDLSGLSQTVASLADYNGAGGSVVNNSSTPVTLTVGNNSTDAPNFSGAITDTSAANAVSLAKLGTGTQVLSGANSFRGTTTVSNGTLVVDGSLGTNAVAVRGGTLAGNGVIAGPVTVYANGVLSPGSNSIGTLTISSSLTFANDGTNFMEINKSLQTNDAIAVAGTLTYGGTLVVTNLAGDLRVGDSFQLFNAGSHAGNFTTLNLPPLGPGLAWDTDGLTNGVLTVVLGAVAPQFGQLSQAGTNLTFSGSGGAAGAGYSLLGSTNLMLPLTNWSLILTGAFDNAGNFSLTNDVDPLSPGQFYELRIP